MPRARRVTDPSSLACLGIPQAESLVPCQQPTKAALLTSADCYQQRCLKCPEICTFHSYAEYIYALLLEGDPRVRSFVPQPFKLRTGKELYTPDFYVLRNGKEYVLELKPNGKMELNKKKTVAAFFDFYGMNFEVVDNDEVLMHEQEALHWLPIIQVLVCAEEYNLDTQALEHQLWQKCLAYMNDPAVGDILLPEDSAIEGLHEVALYRLIYRHRLTVDLTEQALSYDTVLHRCE